MVGPRWHLWPASVWGQKGRNWEKSCTVLGLGTGIVSVCPLLAVSSIPAALMFVGLGQGPSSPARLGEMLLANMGGISRGADGEPNPRKPLSVGHTAKTAAARAAGVHPGNGPAPIPEWVPWTCCALSSID